MKLIPNASRDWWRFWSVRLTAIGAALQSLFLTWATLPLDLWNMMPVEVKDYVHPVAVKALPLVFFVAAMIARFVKQGHDDDQR